MWAFYLFWDISPLCLHLKNGDESTNNILLLLAQFIKVWFAGNIAADNI